MQHGFPRTLASNKHWHSKSIGKTLVTAALAAHGFYGGYTWNWIKKQGQAWNPKTKLCYERNKKLAGRMFS